MKKLTLLPSGINPYDLWDLTDAQLENTLRSIQAEQKKRKEKAAQKWWDTPNAHKLVTL